MNAAHWPLFTLALVAAFAMLAAGAWVVFKLTAGDLWDLD